MAIWILHSQDGRELVLRKAWPQGRPENWPATERSNRLVVENHGFPITLLFFGCPELDGDAQMRQLAVHTAAVLWTYPSGGHKPHTPEHQELAYFSHEYTLALLGQKQVLTCTKCLIPSTERFRVFKHLEEMGIDAYKIHGTRDARIRAAMDRAITRHWRLREPGAVGAPR